MANLDPVEIEINLVQNVSGEADKAAAGIENLSTVSKASLEKLEKDFAAQVEVIKNMQFVIDELQKKIAEGSGDVISQESVDRLNEAQEVLTEVSNTVNAYQENMSAMTEANQQGADITQVFTEASQTLSENQTTLADTMGEILETHNELNEATEQNTESTDENTESMEHNTVANKLMSATIKGICDALGIENTAVVQSISNTRTITAVKTAWSKATAILNTQLGISITMSKALVATGIGVLIAAIVGAILIYNQWKKAQEDSNRLLEEQRKLHIEATSSIQAQVTKVETLEKVLKNQNLTYDQRNSALMELKSIMPEYNALLDKEGKLIVDNTNALTIYIQKLKSAALAKGAADKFTSAQNKLTEKLSEIDLTPEQKSIYDLTAEEIRKRNDKDLTEAWAFLHSYTIEEEENLQLWSKELEKYAAETVTVIKEGTKAFYESIQKQGNAVLQTIKATDLELLKAGKRNLVSPEVLKTYDKAIEDINTSTEKLKLYDVAGQTKAEAAAEKKAAAEAKRAQKAAEKEKERQQKATEDLAKKSLDIQAKIDAARVAAIEDGAAKQRAAIKAEYDKEKALIEQELKEISKLEKITGKPATEQRNQLDEYGTALDNQFAFDNKKLNEESAKQIKAIFDDVNQKFRGELENNLYAIKTYYDEQVKAAQKAGATLEQINTLNAARSKETAQAERQNQLQTLAFETDIAARRLALSKDFYVFESDRIRKQVELQKKAARERLKILNDQYKESPTPELAQDIDEANVAISEMDKVIKKLSSQKFQEIAGYVSQIAGGLSELLGADSSAGVAMGWISEFADAGMKIASGDPKAMIEGTIQAALTIKDIIKTNAQANKEIREFAYELEQAAINYSIAIIAAMKDLKSVNDSLFYTDTNNSLIQGMEGYNAATQKEIDLVSKLGDTTVAVGKKKKRFLGVTTGTKTIWESILTGYKKVLDTDDELIDKNGQVNKQIAESLLNSGKLSKEATNLINQILDAQDAAEAAMAQVESTLESLAGSIGDDLKTALIDAFQDGGAIGAAEKFKESVSKTLEDIVTDKMFTAIYGEMLGELEERMKGSYSMGGDEDLVDDIMWFYKQSQEGADKFYEQLAKAKEQLKQEGFDILSDAEREGASKGIATASQDSINELNGGVYALRQSVNTLVNLDKESILIQKTQSAALDRIADNSEHLKLLPAIKGQLEDLNNKGVTLRNR